MSLENIQYFARQSEFGEICVMHAGGDWRDGVRRTHPEMDDKDSFHYNPHDKAGFAVAPGVNLEREADRLYRELCFGRRVVSGGLFEFSYIP